MRTIRQWLTSPSQTFIPAKDFNPPAPLAPQFADGAPDFPEIPSTPVVMFTPPDLSGLPSIHSLYTRARTTITQG
jgi:hypothetical protein